MSQSIHVSSKSPHSPREISANLQEGFPSQHGNNSPHSKVSALPEEAGHEATDIATFTDDVVLSEDLGPRTLHRKSKPKPGVPFKVIKARYSEQNTRSDDEEDGDPQAPIAVLPPEILARIFAFLDPSSLVRCMAVCRAFLDLLHDDATWRLAFSLAFDIESDGNTKSTPLLRRVDSTSWRAEYFKRTAQLRLWKRTRSPAVISDPRIGPIHAIALSLPHNFLLSASDVLGVATRCQPFTGRITKGFIDASGQVTGIGVGAMALAAQNHAQEVFCLRLDADASRIIWGFSNGAIGITTLGKQGSDPRGAIRGCRFPVRHGHMGPVLNIAVPFGMERGGAHSIERSPDKIRQKQAILGEASETFVTVGADGAVRLWSPHRPFPIWSDVVQRSSPNDDHSPSARVSPAISVAFHIESGTIAAGTLGGCVTLWTNIDITALLRIPASAYDTETHSLDPLPSALLDGRKTLGFLRSQVRRVSLPSLQDSHQDSSRAPRVLILDIDYTENSVSERATDHSARLLVLCNESSGFERFQIDLDTATITSRTMFKVPNGGEISCLRPDFDILHSSSRQPSSVPMVSKPGSPAPQMSNPTSQPLYAERKYVCAGTKNGRLIFWDWDQEHDQAHQVNAWYSLDGHHTSITAIDFTEHAIVIGCSDGTVKALCPITGQLIRTLNDKTATRHPARMLAAGELTAEEASRFMVTHVVAAPQCIVASIGSQILAWRPELPRTKSSSRKSTSRTGRATVGRLWDPKMQSMKEMERDVYETQQELQQEQQDRLDAQRRVGTLPASELDGLTEEEMFEYAMMLSRDEAENRQSQDVIEDPDLQDALQQIAVAESEESSRMASIQASDRETDEGAHYTLNPASHSPSPMSSPYLRAHTSPPTRAWDILQSAGSSASRSPHVGDAHSKVHTVHVPRAARHSSTSSGFGSRRPSNSPSHQGLAHLSSPKDWPVFESSSLSGRSPSKLDLGPSERSEPSGQCPSANYSSSVSPTPSSLPKGGRLGAWAQGSPSLKPVTPNGHPSALTSSRPALVAHSPGVQSREDLDDDLRLAIELSLAEEQSRHNT